MKRGILIYALLLGSFLCHAAILKWDGQAGDGQWYNELNWDANRIPDPADHVVLDNTYITGDYNVFLPPGNILVSLLSLEIAPSSSVIQCILPQTSTASPALLLTGEGDVFVLHNGAVFRNASGATAGTPVTVTASGIFRINNGGHYIHQSARGHTDFLVSRLSTAAGTEEGIFEFDVPGTASYTVSVSGRVFGRVVFSAASAGAVRTYTGAGINPVLIRGGLEIKSNVVFSYGANTDTITVFGKSQIQPGAIFNIANGSNRSVVSFRGDLDNQGLITETGSSIGSSIIMNGTSGQTISCTGTITQQVKIVLDNPAGISLLTPLHLSYGLEFVRGKLYTSAVNLLMLGPDAFCTGASPLGFAEGPVRKTGSAAFLFPVGAGGIFAPVSIGPGGSETDEFVAEYKRANPQSTPGLGNFCIYPINHISYVEYWNLVREAGVGSRQVGLSVTPYSFAYNLEALVVARNEAGQWLSEGGMDHLAGASSPPWVAGSYVSLAAVEKFGAFTIGSLINQAQNPLPLPVEHFDAVFSNGQVRLDWKTGICPAGSIRFELAHAGPDMRFKNLLSSYGNDTTCSDAYVHAFPNRKENFYRLNVIDEWGRLAYSKVLNVMLPESGSPATDRVGIIRSDDRGIELKIQLPEGQTVFIIVDGIGRILFSCSYSLSGSEEKIRLPVNCVSKGLHRVIVVTGKEKINVAFLR